MSFYYFQLSNIHTASLLDTDVLKIANAVFIIVFTQLTRVFRLLLFCHHHMALIFILKSFIIGNIIFDVLFRFKVSFGPA